MLKRVFTALMLAGTMMLPSPPVQAAQTLAAAPCEGLRMAAYVAD